MAYLVGAFFGAGSDTVCPYLSHHTQPSGLNVSFQTATAITVMIIATACHPEAQAPVQEKLDEVVGRDRGMSTLRFSVPEDPDVASSPHVWRPGYASATGTYARETAMEAGGTERYVFCCHLSTNETAQGFNICLYARLCTPFDEGHYSGMSSSAVLRLRCHRGVSVSLPGRLSLDDIGTSSMAHGAPILTSCFDCTFPLTTTRPSRGTWRCCQIHGRWILNVGSRGRMHKGRHVFLHARLWQKVRRLLVFLSSSTHVHVAHRVFPIQHVPN